MRQHFDSLVCVAERNLSQLPGIKTDLFEQTILLAGIIRLRSGQSELCCSDHKRIAIVKREI